MIDTSIMPIRSVAVGGATLQIQPIILVRTRDGVEFLSGLVLRRPDSPTGEVVASFARNGRSSAWISHHECPRAIVRAITDPGLEALHDLKIPSIDDLEREAEIASKEAGKAWHRFWSSDRNEEARAQKRICFGYGELHRLIRVARVKRANASVYAARSDKLIS